MKLLRLFTVAVLFIGLAACSSSDQVTPEKMAAQLKKSDKLYVTEYVVHKLITAEDFNKIKGTVMGKDFSMNLAIGDRKIAIPMNVVLKAYIDFDSLNVKDVIITENPKMIKLLLKEPKVEMTSSKIDHNAIEEYTGIFRSSFSDAEMTDFEHQGRQAILGAIPDMGIIKTAENNAKETLIPILMQAGFDANQIQIEFNR